MTSIQCIELLQALLGTIGTIILFFNSYSLEPYEGAAFGGDEVNEYNEKVEKKNFRRLIWQKIGFALLCVSFIIQFSLILTQHN